MKNKAELLLTELDQREFKLWALEHEALLTVKDLVSKGVCPQHVIVEVEKYYATKKKQMLRIHQAVRQKVHELNPEQLDRVYEHLIHKKERMDKLLRGLIGD